MALVIPQFCIPFFAVLTFSKLVNETNLEQALNSLGEYLDKHIRKEERQLFPLIERHCSEKQLIEIKDLFQ